MGRKKVQPNYRRRTLRLPDLDHSKLAVLNSLGSPGSRRVYEFALNQFIAWYCSEPRLAFNRIVVTRYRMYLESRGLAANTINQQLAAVRRIAHEAADAGLLTPELAAGISRVKGVKQLGFRAGNWLSADECSAVLSHAFGSTLRAKRDYAMLAMLFGCGFRRSELVGLEIDDIQVRQGHWAVVDLIGKGGHIRTVSIPLWAKAALDDWTSAALISKGKIFRAVARTDKIWGEGISQNVVWYVVKGCAEKAGLQHIAPHDLRRTCAKLCHTNGGEIEQIQFLLGHASVQTTERYLGCKQNLGHPVNDLFRLGTLHLRHRMRSGDGTRRGFVSDALQIVPVVDSQTVANEALRERAVSSSRSQYTKHYVVHDQDNEVAFLSVDPRPDLNLFVIYEIFVVPEIRFRGMGTRVLLAAENLARQNGFPRARLVPRALGYPPGDERERQTAKLIEWYERHGYRAAADSGFEEWQKEL